MLFCKVLQVCVHGLCSQSVHPECGSQVWPIAGRVSLYVVIRRVCAPLASWGCGKIVSCQPGRRTQRSRTSVFHDCLNWCSVSSVCLGRKHSSYVILEENIVAKWSCRLWFQILLQQPAGFLEASLACCKGFCKGGQFRAKAAGQQREYMFPCNGMRGVVAPHCCGVHEMGPSCGESRTQK